MKINQDEICHATSKSFHSSSIYKMKDVMNEKNAGCYLRDSSRWFDNQILIDS